MQRTLYEVLEVSSRASPETIRAAYKSLLQRYHPDKNPGNPEIARLAREMVSAYQVLSDPESRKAYDATLQLEQENRSAQYPPFGADSNERGAPQSEDVHDAKWEHASDQPKSDDVRSPTLRRVRELLGDWSAARPVYRTALTGTQVDDAQWQEKLKSKPVSWGWLLLSIAIPGLILVFLSQSNDTDSAFGIAVLLTLIIAPIAVLIRSALIGPSVRAILTEKRLNAYADFYEGRRYSPAMHRNWRVSLMIFILPIYVPIVAAYYGLHNIALVWIAIFATMTVISLEAGAADSSSLLSVFVFSAAYYYFIVEKAIFDRIGDEIVNTPQSHTHNQTVVLKGSLLAGFLSVVVLVVVIGVLDLMYEDDPASVVAQQILEPEARGEPSTRSAEQIQNEYAQALLDVETRYPKLNPDSPLFDEAITLMIAQRMNDIRATGYSPADSLKKAVAEFEEVLIATR